MRCYRHPNRAATASCVRCGNFICDVCDVLAGGKHYCKACLERSGPAPADGPRRFVRTRHDRILAGVCGGLARHFGMDPTLVRVLYAIGTIITGFVPLGVVYIILAFVAPEEE